MAGILDGGVPQDFGLSGVGVDLNVNQMHAERITLARGIQTRRTGDPTAGGVQLARQILEGETQLFGLVPDHAPVVFDVFGRNVPDGGGPFDHLLLDVFRRENGCPTGGEGGPAAASDHRIADGIGVYNLRFDVVVRYSQGFRRLLSD